MTWIKTISYKEATGRLKQMYDRLKGPGGQIDNILVAHSLRPHTLDGHLALYKTVLHHSANRLDRWLLEAIGTYVSMLNHCNYCVNHHYHGMKNLLADEARAKEIRQAFEGDNLAEAFTENQIILFEYARKLTLQAATVGAEDIECLRGGGYDDGEILEVNQVTAYFNYANRVILGLGVTLDGERLGHSPGKSDSEK